MRNTDAAVTIVFFAVGFLVFCGVAAAVCHVLQWRDEKNAKRTSRRLRVLLSRYGYEIGDPAPDFVPAEWERAA